MQQALAKATDEGNFQIKLSNKNQSEYTTINLGINYFIVKIKAIIYIKTEYYRLRFILSITISKMNNSAFSQLDSKFTYLHFKYQLKFYWPNYNHY